MGTTQAACYYGVPSVVVPRGFDQFENAAHVQRNGWGLRLLPQDFSPTPCASPGTPAAVTPTSAPASPPWARHMRAEPGPARTADLLEAALEP